jgi:hypothetical protein
MSTAVRAHRPKLEEEEMVTFALTPWSESPRSSEEALQTQPLIGTEAGSAVQEKRLWFQRRPAYDPDAIATQPSVFDDPELA